MSLSIKQKAALATAGVFAFAILAGIGIDFIARNVSAEVISFVAGAGVLLFFANIMYTIFVSKFEYEEKHKINKD